MPNRSAQPYVLVRINRGRAARYISIMSESPRTLLHRALVARLLADETASSPEKEELLRRAESLERQANLPEAQHRVVSPSRPRS